MQDEKAKLLSAVIFLCLIKNAGTAFRGEKKSFFEKECQKSLLKGLTF